MDSLRPNTQDSVGALEQHRHPPWAVVRPSRIYDLASVDVQLCGNRIDRRLVDWARTDQLRSSESETVVGPPHAD
jgi:hypothetical protein